MDLIGSLPPEISHKIFLYLSVPDLFSCMIVCKKWRSLINCKYIWGYFYEALGLSEDPSSSIAELTGGDDLDIEGSVPPLCSRAREVKNYFLGPSYNWKMGRCYHIHMNMPYKHWKSVFHHPYLAVFYCSTYELHIYRCEKQNLLHTDFIHVYLPNEPEELRLFMNSKFIVINSFNITYVIKLEKSHFFLFKTFAICSNEVHETDKKFDVFVEKNIIPKKFIIPLVLVDNVLWIADTEAMLVDKYIINLDTGEIQILENLFSYKLVPLRSSKYILHLSRSHYKISDFMGNEISSICSFPGQKHFVCNDRILAIVFAYSLSNHVFPIELWSISEGFMLSKIFVPKQTKIALHPKKDILYCLSSKDSYYTCSALCIRTEKKIWEYLVSSTSQVLLGSFIAVIGNRFLFAYPSPSSEDNFTLFSMQGKPLYESVLPPGILLHFSEKAIISSESGRLHLYNYF